MKWGIDLGGTKIEGVVMSGDTPEDVIYRKRVPTEQQMGYDHIIGQIHLLVQDMEKNSPEKPSHIGMGTPGALDPFSKKLKNSNTTCLNGKHLQRDIEKKTGYTFRLANDANCFALAESTMGAGSPYLDSGNVIFGVIMGTGVGGGLVHDRKVIGGHHGIGGEWGHIFLDDEGGDCYCGKKGCVETILSGPATERYYSKMTGRQMRLPEIVKFAKEGQKEAKETLHRMMRFFGKGIAQVINIVDPACIILGGGVGNIDLLYTEGVEEAKKHIFNPSLQTHFLRPKLGDSAGVFGAAFL